MGCPLGRPVQMRAQWLPVFWAEALPQPPGTAATEHIAHGALFDMW